MTTRNELKEKLSRKLRATYTQALEYTDETKTSYKEPYYISGPYKGMTVDEAAEKAVEKVLGAMLTGAIR